MQWFIPLILSLSVAQTSAPKPAEVLLLGTYHMANPKLDAVKIEIRDTLGEQRQKEILELNKMLAKFKPTKILIESPPDSATSEAHYQEFLAGKRSLSANEIQQVGYRLAQQFGHSKLYGVDHKLDMNVNAVMQWAAKNQRNDFMMKFGGVIKKIEAALTEIDQKYSVAQILALMNQPEFLTAQQTLYVEIAKMGSKTEFPGADMLASWYQRNVRIYTLMRQVIEPGDRVLVIFGAGHIHFLKSLVAESGDLKLADPLKYLPKPPKFNFDIKF